MLPPLPASRVASFATMPSIIGRCASGMAGPPPAAAGLPLERRQASVHHAAPRRIGRRIGEQRLVVPNGVVLLAILLGGERDIIARLRLARLLRERPIERLPRLASDHTASGGDQSLAVGRAPQRLLAEEAQRLG